MAIVARGIRPLAKSGFPGSISPGVRYADSRIKGYLIAEILCYVLHVYYDIDEVPENVAPGLGRGWTQVLLDNPAFLIGDRFPKRIRVGGHDMNVRFPYLFNDREDLYGRCHNHVNEIHVAGVDAGGVAICESKKWAILLHEINHAIHLCFCPGLEDKETVTEAMAQGLYQVFVDNNLDFRGEIKEE